MIISENWEPVIVEESSIQILLIWYTWVRTTDLNVDMLKISRKLDKQTAGQNLCVLFFIDAQRWHFSTFFYDIAGFPKHTFPMQMH